MKAIGVDLGAEIDAARLHRQARECGFNAIAVLAGSSDDPAGMRSSRLAGELLAPNVSNALEVWVSVSLGLVDDGHPLVTDIAPDAFGRGALVAQDVVDPRTPFARAAGAVPLRRPARPRLWQWWEEQLALWRDMGAQGFLLVDPEHPARALAETLGRAGYRFATVWRDRIDKTAPGLGLIDENDLAETTGALGPLLLSARGWIFRGKIASRRSVLLQEANELFDQVADGTGRVRNWPSEQPGVVVTTRENRRGALVSVTNTSARPVTFSPSSLAGLSWPIIEPLFRPRAEMNLGQGEIVYFVAENACPVVSNGMLCVERAAEPSRRIIIERYLPTVEEGKYAVKRVIAEPLEVIATIYSDGHDKLAGCLLHRAEDEPDWTRVPLTEAHNDKWHATIRFNRLGRHEMMIEAWFDTWGTFSHAYKKKQEAGQNLTVETLEALILLKAALPRADGAAATVIVGAIKALEADPVAGSGDVIGDIDLSAAMAAAGERMFLTRSFSQTIMVEREAAKFSSWYELFPRSQGPGPSRHGTFRDVIGQLPRVAAMGFDTLYFPPIHPIGRTNRKGRNNALVAAQGDVGSPYAIGSQEGGHDAIHPELGTVEEFQSLIESAELHGLEIALDFAIQCSPDHPWLKEHPGWFSWRPDGSIKYAENPPKKYQDIVNVEFYSETAIPDLWLSLRDIVIYWIKLGVKTFRVDNPHTKPFAFWQWLIGDVKCRHPEVIFLSEAFTRPGPMYHLAKIGFSQSYTYFTWRNTKSEIIEYLTELTQSEVREFYRPHFFVNTPDINPRFLQTSGRPGFLIRAVLAATMSSLWGVYAGFELCESGALEGREEYVDSEKYEIRHRPERQNGDIVDEIALLNKIRCSESTLQSNGGLEFHNVLNDNILVYSKRRDEDSSLVLIAVSLDPHVPQGGQFEAPIWRLGLPDWGRVNVDDLLTGERFQWFGKWQHLALSPLQPYCIWRLDAISES